MRRILLVLPLLLSACTASANLDPEAPVVVEPVERSDLDRVRVRLEQVDGSIDAVRDRLASAELDADVASQAFDVQVQIVDTLSEIVADLDDQEAKTVDLADRTQSSIERLDQLEARQPGLRPVIRSLAPCGLSTDDGGIIYRIAPDVRRDEWLLRTTDDGGLRIESPVEVVCGATQVGPGTALEVAPSVVVEGNLVYVLPEAGAWFHVSG